MSNLILMIVGTVIVFLVILLLFPSGSKNDISGRLASLDDADGSLSPASHPYRAHLGLLCTAERGEIEKVKGMREVKEGS